MKLIPCQRKVTSRGLSWDAATINGRSCGHRPYLSRLECLSLQRALVAVRLRAHPKSRSREGSEPASPCRMGPTSPTSTSQPGRESASLRSSGDYRPPNGRQRSHRGRHLLLGPPGTRGRTHFGYCLRSHPRLCSELGRNAHYFLLPSVTDESPIKIRANPSVPTQAKLAALRKRTSSRSAPLWRVAEIQTIS